MPENIEQPEYNPDDARESAPKLLYHGSVAGDIAELEPRRRSIPGNADPETQPELTYASDNPAFAAAHSFLWGTNEGFRLSVESDGVLFQVPNAHKDRLAVPVSVYTVPGEGYTLSQEETTGHTYQSATPVKPTAVESFPSVQAAIEHFGGRVEYYDPE